jgi:hypothetical protein
MLNKRAINFIEMQLNNFAIDHAHSNAVYNNEQTKENLQDSLERTKRLKNNYGLECDTVVVADVVVPLQKAAKTFVDLLAPG